MVVGNYNAGLMQTHLYKDLALKERGYWWHVVRRRNLMRTLGNSGLKAGRVLEIGCGTGANLRELRQCGFTVAGLDRSHDALAHAQECPVIQADGEASLPFRDNSFDAIVMMDVLEHLREVGPVLEEVRRLLKPGGVALVMVPADPALWSYWDEMLGHYRRYTPELLSSSFGEGWQREDLGYSFSYMYWPVRLVRFLREGKVDLKAHSDFTPVPSWVNALLIGAGNIEMRISGLVKPPFGTTLTGLWRKVA